MPSKGAVFNETFRKNPGNWILLLSFFVLPPVFLGELLVEDGSVAWMVLEGGMWIIVILVLKWEMRRATARLMGHCPFCFQERHQGAPCS